MCLLTRVVKVVKPKVLKVLRQQHVGKWTKSKPCGLRSLETWRMLPESTRPRQPNLNFSAKSPPSPQKDPRIFRQVLGMSSTSNRFKQEEHARITAFPAVLGPHPAQPGPILGGGLQKQCRVAGTLHSYCCGRACDCQAVNVLFGYFGFKRSVYF